MIQYTLFCPNNILNLCRITGGEAAILAYAGSVVGIGNDFGGSIRMPAAFNGIYGLKSSPGMLKKLIFKGFIFQKLDSMNVNF